MAKSVVIDLALGAGLALGLLAYIAASAAPETVALVEGSQAPLTTLLIVAGSLVLYTAFGVALTGLLLHASDEAPARARPHGS